MRADERLARFKVALALRVGSELNPSVTNSKTLSPYYSFVMTTIVENYHSTVSSLVTVNCRSMTVMR